MSAAAPPGAAPTAATPGTLALLACASFFASAALRVCDPLLPQFASEFGLSAGAAGQVVIAFSVAYGVLQLAFGPLGDRYGKLRMICLALFGCSAAAAASTLAPSFATLTWARMAWGMAAAGVIPLAMAWIGDNVPYERRQATLARFLMGTLSGMVAGTLLGGLFADSRFGWRGAFVVLMIGCLVVGAALLGRLRREPPRDAAAPRPRLLAQLRQVLAVRWARVVLLAVFAEGLLLLGALAYMPTYLHARFGVSLSLASAITACYALGGLGYALGARRLLARWGEGRMVRYGGLLIGAGFLAFWLLPHWWPEVLAVLAIGFGTYLFHATLQTHATQMAPAVRGSSVALFAFCLFTGQALGTAGAGMLVDAWGFAPLLLLATAGLPLVAIAFEAALGRRG